MPIGHVGKLDQLLALLHGLHIIVTLCSIGVGSHVEWMVRHHLFSQQVPSSISIGSRHSGLLAAKPLTKRAWIVLELCE